MKWCHFRLFSLSLQRQQMGMRCCRDRFDAQDRAISLELHRELAFSLQVSRAWICSSPIRSANPHSHSDSKNETAPLLGGAEERRTATRLLQTGHV